MNYVEPKKTPLKIREAALALSKALGNPSRATLLVALAKTGLETGEFQAMWNHNWGNIKAMGSYAGDYTCIHLNEVLPGRGLVWFAPEGELTGKRGQVVGEVFAVPPGHPQTRMRAYASAEAGAADYVAFVAQKKRYAKAWAELLAGNEEGYVRELKAAGYFTANEALYLKGVRWRMSVYESHIKGIGA